MLMSVFFPKNYSLFPLKKHFCRLVNTLVRHFSGNNIGIIYEDIFHKLKIHQTRTIYIVMNTSDWNQFRNFFLQNNDSGLSVNFFKRISFNLQQRSNCNSKLCHIEVPNIKNPVLAVAKYGICPSGIPNERG